MEAHGNTAGYVRGCRCDACRDAMRSYMQDWRTTITARVAAGELTIPHGTLGGYNNYACRCKECRNAARLHQRRRRARNATT